MRLLFASVLLLVSAGCASAPAATDRDAVRTAVAGAEAVPAAPADRTTVPALPPGVTLDAGLSMDDAAAVALWNNPDFQAALVSLDIARADLVQAGLLKNPILSLLFPVGPKQFEATASWAVDALWQRPRRVEDARLNVEAVASNLVAHGLRLLADVKLAYLDAVYADRALDVVTEQARTAGEVSRLTDGRLRLGDASELEARMARIESARSQASLASRRATRDLALARLRALLGLPASTTALRLNDASSPAVSECGPLDALTRSALAARPDVRAAELLIDAAGARVGLERSKVLAITASIDMNAQGREGFEAGPGLGIELPVLSQNQGGRARAVAELRQATLRYAAVRAAVVADVEAARVKLVEAREVADAFDAGIGESLARERRQAEGLYEAGEISLLSLLDMRQRLNDVELARVEVGLGVRRARVAVELAIGQRCGTNQE